MTLSSSTRPPAFSQESVGLLDRHLALRLLTWDQALEHVLKPTELVHALGAEH